jgi:HPt (histidine-containing phosphotransfer) domain-containing protein
LTRHPKPSRDDLALLDPDGSFRERLEADRRAIAELSDSSDLDRLRRIVHGLAGAAGTFGYAEIGDIAIELDDSFITGEDIAPAGLARLLAALEQALARPEKSA